VAAEFVASMRPTQLALCLVGALACASRPGAESATPTGAFDDGHDCATDQERARAKGWKFVAFFVDFHCRIEAVWSCEGGPDDKRSFFEISLAPDGALAGVRLASSSGDARHDAAAESAIRRASPYSPPPPQMVQMVGTDKRAVFKTAARCGRRRPSPDAL
jgi:TonB family protein